MKESPNPLEASSAIEPPALLNERILERIRRDLNVNKLTLSLKLLLIHVAVGAATLSFCPQFNIGPIGQGIVSTLHVLMRLHPLLCAVFCGMVFLGSSALVAVLALRSAELLWIKRQAWWVYSLLATASLIVLMSVRSDLHGHYDWSFLLAWCMGAIVSTLAIIYLGAWLRMNSKLAGHLA